ncbi:hypothetical protein PCASD_09340 [Puccinia coronata f. sp. avenae]|uniref:Uncharacterized protein n=1 Tax=Puccinia coronata f. sp. avenae TaxID=200324 RepID=A0A2N5USK8_9BASI|nr:hypothetical protein PCASD_09340 [Puccinia coronata f. sp. avenae]
MDLPSSSDHPTEFRLPPAPTSVHRSSKKLMVGGTNTVSQVPYPAILAATALTVSPPFIQPSVHRLGGRRGLKVRLTVKQPVIQRRWSNQAVSPTVVRLLDHRRDSPNGGTRLVPTILRPYRQATVNTVGARCGIRPTVVQPTPIKGGGPVV